MCVSWILSIFAVVIELRLGVGLATAYFQLFLKKLFFQPIMIMRKYTLLFIALLSITYLKAQEPLDEFEVYDRLIARKTQPGYQEGTPWTNDKIKEGAKTYKVFNRGN